VPRSAFAAAAAALVLLFVAEGLAFIRANSQTSDEAAHLAAGYSYLKRGDFRLNAEHPPLVKELCALPLYALDVPYAPDPDLWARGEGWVSAAQFVYHSPMDADEMMALGRLPNLLLGALLVALIGWWALRLYGRGAALVALALAALEPNLVAHSSLITTDTATALFTTLAVYCLWEHVRAPSLAWVAGVGLATSLAMASKFSNVLLLAILPLVMGAYLAAGGALPRRRPALRGAAALFEEAAPVVLVLSLTSLVIPAVYDWQGFRPWVDGFALVAQHQDRGHAAFLLGEYSNDGWWYYFPVAFAIKTPLGSLALIAASLVGWRRGVPLDRRTAAFLFIPAVATFGILAYGRINIGLRHVLAVYPFLFVAASRVATFRPAARWAAAAALLFAAFSSLRVAPHQLAYFNEAVGGPAEGYRYLNDSNLDWGQGLKELKRFVEREKAPIIYLSYFGSAPPSHYVQYQYVPPGPEPPSARSVPREGRQLLAISLFNLYTVFASDREVFAWLRARRPIARLGWSINVYDLTGDAAALRALDEHYRKCASGTVCGMPSLLPAPP
jgi:4-amino-4-deoxy-L-arabinose transferase-like glycosyltransferase